MEKLNYSKFLMYLRQCQNKIQKDVNEELKKYQLSSSYVGILLLLYDHKDGYSMSELSRLISVDNALMTRNIKGLEDIEYVYRNRENDSQRKYHICLTKKGFEVAEKMKEMMQKKQDDFACLFTEEERKIMEQAIDIVVSKFMKVMKEDDSKC